MFSRKFLKGSSVAVVGASLASGLQCQVTSADAYLEAKNEFGEKFYLPVNKEQAKEMLKGFCEAGLLNKGDLEEANKILDSEQGFSFVRFLLLLIWLDWTQSAIRVFIGFVKNDINFFEKYEKEAENNYPDSGYLKQSFFSYCYALKDHSLLIPGLKFLLKKGKALLDYFKSPVILVRMWVILKDDNQEILDHLLEDLGRLNEENSILKRENTLLKVYNSIVLEEENRKLKEENRELKEENRELKEENRELKEENRELKEENRELSAVPTVYDTFLVETTRGTY